MYIARYKYAMCILVCLYGVGMATADQPTAKVSFGVIQGYFMKTREGRPISAFTGIPYAEPPVADLRFKAPVPIQRDSPDIFDATKPSPVCVQRNPYIRQKSITGQEDCLYLNVYTPVTNAVEEGGLPVLVFLHGGGWMCGDSTTYMYGPEYLLDHDVILVTLNYRLGPLGFLSLQDEHCPGNNGLKDQQEALRFIQKNIRSFGGDPLSVTIFGESAGGASVHYHMLSPNSAGLFHKAISHSGTALVPWAEAPPGEARRNAFRLAKFLDCPQAPPEQMMSCLRAKDSYDIINTEFQFYAWDLEAMTPFKAVVEPDLPGAFLTRSPRKKPDHKLVPWITGLNRDEGCLKSVWITANSSRYQEFLSCFDTIAPVSLYYDNSPYVEDITNEVKDKYMSNSDEETTKRGILDMYSDSYFNYPLVEAVEATLNFSKSPVYLYELTYRATNSFSQIFGDPEGDYGVCHADDLMHIFPIHFLEKPISASDVEISKLIITLWTNFAKSGNPNEPVQQHFKWDPATSGGKMEHLDISRDPVMSSYLAHRSRFWGYVPLWHNLRPRRTHDEL